jgi:acetyl-CoA carboxylase alpha subunit
VIERDEDADVGADADVDVNVDEDADADVDVDADMCEKEKKEKEGKVRETRDTEMWKKSERTRKMHRPHGPGLLQVATLDPPFLEGAKASFFSAAQGARGPRSP